MVGSETIAVPEDLVGKRDTYVLRVKGDSMIDEQIRDGDYVIVEDRRTADNGEMVIALLHGSDVTLKKFYREHGHIRLQPANPAMQPILRRPTRCRCRASSSASCAGIERVAGQCRRDNTRAWTNESKSISPSSRTKRRLPRTYANFCAISHTPFDFTLAFCEVQPLSQRDIQAAEVGAHRPRARCVPRSWSPCRWCRT